VRFYFKVLYPIEAHHPTIIFCFCGITYMSFWELITACPNSGRWAPFS